ncbi:hypothetical protein [Bradyrhizobium sp. BR 1432]|uniref:hypothetical protein n=1 Tax=Bradyrhizobium sp. BR 1432 TaxID=3447966 RepID=UPI003EE61DFB
MRLLHWTKELPKASEADPLGLELRVSARLSNELLYCITSITPRARYYAFFPWALQDYNERERLTKGDRGRVQGVLARERAMVLGAVLHHEGAACDGGGLGGSDKADELERSRYYDLIAWRHLKNSQGQFGAAYKGSLINLGVFKADDEEVSEDVEADTNELDEKTQSIEIRELSPLGQRLANAFKKSVQTTAYVAQAQTLKNKVASDVLTEFGKKAGLCEITHKNAKDRDVLREVFFAACEELNRPSHHRRRMSLLLFLECAAKAKEAGASLDERTFSDICYFDAIVLGDEERTRQEVVLSTSLSDIQQRWRVFATQGYLAVALQSLLVAVVRQIRDQPAGVERTQLVRLLNPPSLTERLKEVSGLELPGDFLQMTPRDTLALCGLDVRDPGQSALSAEAPFSERQLEEWLIEDEANEASCVVLAATLLYQIVLRHKQRCPVQFNNWYGQQIHNHYADVALPGIIRFFEDEFGKHWVERTNGEILDRIVWRFIVRQHQTMSYERGFGGVAPLFHVDGTRVVATEMDYTNPRAKNPRFRPALRILADLKLIVEGDEGYELTEEGETWLATELARTARP